MEHGPQDWMTAAACAEGPRPTVTFADLPPQHQGDMVRLALVATASAVYFIVLAVSAPLASRSFATNTELPRAVPAQLALPPQLVRAAAETMAARRSATRPRPAVALASLREPAGGPPSITTSPRRNPFSRFFRGVLLSVSPN